MKEEYFKVEIKNSEVVSYSFTQTTPFLLYIKKDIEEQEAVFEFTGKILLDDYPMLISKDTFKNVWNILDKWKSAIWILIASSIKEKSVKST